MKIAASFSMGRLAPKHDLNIHGSRAMSPNVTPNLIKDDVILVDHLRTQTGAYKSIDEYTDNKLQPYIDQYNARQRRQDRCITTGYSEWHRNNGTLSQGKGELAYEAVLQYGTHEDLGGEYYSSQTTPERKAELKAEFERVYRGWVADLQRDFPHMEVVYAVVHFSEVEGTPHCHVCLQPLDDCSRGLLKQVSIGRALTQDGIGSLRIFPLPSSHTKGCLGLEVDSTYGFVGDALYCRSLNGTYVYNVQLLRDEIAVLKSLRAPYLLSSHYPGFVRAREDAIAELETIYSRRTSNDPFIRLA